MEPPAHDGNRIALGAGPYCRVRLRPPKRLQPHEASMVPEPPGITETLVRVNYSETDQMGVVYHARYLVWLDVARTEHLRRSGISYRDLETSGLRLAVGEVAVR